MIINYPLKHSAVLSLFLLFRTNNNKKLLLILYLLYVKYCSGASLIAQLIKNPPATQETLVRFLSQEDPLEKG